MGTTCSIQTIAARTVAFNTIGPRITSLNNNKKWLIRKLCLVSQSHKISIKAKYSKLNCSAVLSIYNRHLSYIAISIQSNTHYVYSCIKPLANRIPKQGCLPHSRTNIACYHTILPIRRQNMCVHICTNNGLCTYLFYTGHQGNQDHNLSHTSRLFGDTRLDRDSTHTCDYILCRRFHCCMLLKQNPVID